MKSSGRSLTLAAIEKRRSADLLAEYEFFRDPVFAKAANLLKEEIKIRKKGKPTNLIMRVS